MAPSSPRSGPPDGTRAVPLQIAARLPIETPHQTTHLMHCRPGDPSVRKSRRPRGRVGARWRPCFWGSLSQPVHTSVRNVACRGMSDIESNIRQVPAGECPRCGGALPQRGTGRPAKWCSQRCRRAAYEERRAAARGVVAIELVRPVMPVKEHDLSECVSRVAASPTACRRVLQAMAKLARNSDLLADPKWQPAIDAFVGLADALYRRPPSIAVSFPALTGLIRPPERSVRTDHQAESA